MKYFERYYCHNKLFNITYNKINKQVKNVIKTADIFLCLKDGIDFIDLIKSIIPFRRIIRYYRYYRSNR